MDMQTDSLVNELDEFVITKKTSSTTKLRNTATNTDLLTSAELQRAACCNLGEAFTTNPSVDVNYSDAATGARQIKLLGLPGTYVQMLTENIPNLRGAGAQFGLNYIPGPWMQSIQVSKGASSVKQGYESVTGQINIEMLKPQTEPSLALNMYADHHGKVEANFTGNLHLSPRWSSGLLVHAENSFSAHDENDDGFADNPKIKQISAMNRWAYFSDNYIFQAAAKFLHEDRQSGQIGHHAAHLDNPYTIDIQTNRWEAFAKNAYIFDSDNNGNVALILSGSLHDQNSNYGHKVYDINHKTLYASLMFERNFGEAHALSAGLSMNHDYYKEQYRLTHNISTPLSTESRGETTPGAYVQYTFDLYSKLMLMAGLRYDWSSRWHSFITPRIHARWNLLPTLSIHASAGEGYRTPNALLDNSFLLASSRQIIIDGELKQEKAWNFGGGLSGNFSLFGRDLKWSAEYYYTNFINQAILNLDQSPSLAIVSNLTGKSFSHAAQAEIDWQLLEDMNITLAYRYTDVKVDYGHGTVLKPLVSRSKALFSVNYTPFMGLWEFDATLALTGGGRMPDPDSVNPAWNSRYKAFPTLNAQVTRNFRHWSIYIGGENLTGYKQKTPVIGASDPWGNGFDATMIYAPVNGPMAYIGFRYNFTKY